MLPEIERLLVLQDRDRKLRRLRQELEAAPKECAALEQKLRDVEKTAETAKNKARDIEVERKRLELEAQAKRDGIARFRTQQFQTRKNEEFQALGNEIARFEKEIGAIEDRELELMEEQEQAGTRLKASEKLLREQSSLIAQQIADVEAKSGSLAAQVEAVSGERAKLAEGLEEDLLYRYNRLFATKGDAVVVPVEHEVCMGCHMKITTQAAVQVKAEREIVHCEQCGRILYRGD